MNVLVGTPNNIRARQRKFRNLIQHDEQSFRCAFVKIVKFDITRITSANFFLLCSLKMKITNLMTRGINTSSLGKYPYIFGLSNFTPAVCRSSSSVVPPFKPFRNIQLYYPVPLLAKQLLVSLKLRQHLVTFWS